MKYFSCYLDRLDLFDGVWQFVELEFCPDFNGFFASFSPDRLRLRTATFPRKRIPGFGVGFGRCVWFELRDMMHFNLNHISLSDSFGSFFKHLLKFIIFVLFGSFPQNFEMFINFHHALFLKFHWFSVFPLTNQNHLNLSFDN